MDAGTNWEADPLVWGTGRKSFEAFLEPTCPFSKIAFGKLDDLLESIGPDKISVRIWIQSQPWHLFSGIVSRTIIAASTTPDGKEAAKKVMSAVYAAREDFEFDDHRSGPNLNATPTDVVRRIESESGVDLSDAFQISGLEKVIKQHTRYGRQNGIHVSPTFMVDGLVDDRFSSGDSVADWASRLTP